MFLLGTKVVLWQDMENQGIDNSYIYVIYRSYLGTEQLIFIFAI